MLMSTTDSERASPGYTVFHVSAQLEKQYDGWLKHRSNDGAMVAVWRCGNLKSMCMREFGSTQCSVDAIDVHWIRIEFALGNSVTELV